MTSITEFQVSSDYTERELVEALEASFSIAKDGGS